MFDFTIKERLCVSGAVIFLAVIVCLATPLTTDIIIGATVGTFLYHAGDHIICRLRKRA